jgi:hypothetical protein
VHVSNPRAIISGGRTNLNVIDANGDGCLGSDVDLVSAARVEGVSVVSCDNCFA